MQEEVEQKTMTLSINATKFSGRVLKAAVSKYLAHRRNSKTEKKHEKQSYQDVIPHGKQKMKDLIGQNQGVSNIDVSDKDMKGFERIARKYGVDYAVKRVKGQNKYLVFFKSRDADAITGALTEFADKKQRQQNRPSLRKMLQKMKLRAQHQAPPVRNQHQERSR